MDKMKMQTKDIANENFRKLAALFPDAVTETINADGEVVRAIDKDQLMQDISATVVEGNEERYQFTWPDKREAIRLASSPITATLRPCPAESSGKDGTPGKFDSENLYIEGDNLDVLKLLRETYLGKVKMIYIDPPYNTGNDFVYNDGFSADKDSEEQRNGAFDEEGNQILSQNERNTAANGRFHTDWLNMIYPRLKIAKDLLADDGVIFISIDDNEQENLKKICDEIYGSSNFVAQLVWEKKKKGSFLSNAITNIKEYVLVYCGNLIHFVGLIGEINDSEETYPCINAVNKRETRILPAGIESKYKEKNYFLKQGSEISDTTMSLILHSDLVIKDGILQKELIIEGNWRYSQQAMTEYALNHKIYITRDLYLRRIVSDTRYKTLKDLLSRVGDDSDVGHNSSINILNLNASGWGSNEDADEELRVLFGVQKLMDYPKPLRLILKLLASYRTKTDCLVIDFFSGSATTAHAVMQLNAEDGGKRKFIMVQLPEICDVKSEAAKAGYKNICEIGKERIRRAGKKIKEELENTKNMKKEKEGQENLSLFDEAESSSVPSVVPDIGFRVLKLDSTNMEDVYYNPAETKQADLLGRISNIKSDRTPEDLLFQVMLELGVLPSSKIEKSTIAGKQVFNVADNFLIACFDDNITDEVVTAIAKQKPTYVVVRDSGFASDSVAANFEQIFATYSPDTTRRIL